MAITTSMLQRTIDLLRTLVRFDTCSANSNLELIDFVVGYLKSYGIDAALTHDETGRKANLFATIGRADRAGICLSGHSDVVPVSGQAWSHTPFDLTERDDKLYGRGTADMKGFIAAMLASVPVFIEQSAEVPIHLAISYDEEIGCVGVRRLLAALEEQPVRPLACIIGEPTSMRLAVAHKGKRAWRCCVHGRAGHSALTHLGVNAAECGAELVAFLRRVGGDLRASGAQDGRFQPPYTTVHTGKIHGGIALNVIPERCEIEFEIRNLPDEDPDAIFEKIQSYAQHQLAPDMQAIDRGAGFEWHPLTAYPALQSAPEGEWLRRLASNLLGTDQTETLSFGTEGGLFQAIGIPTIVCGPGSIEKAHRADEYLERSQLVECLTFMRRLAETLAREDTLVAIPVTST